MQRLKGWSPSDFERYSTCTASPALITEMWPYISRAKQHLTNGAGSNSALEGEHFHELFEFCSFMDCSPTVFIKREKFYFKGEKRARHAKPDMVSAVRDCLEYLDNVTAEGDIVSLEKQITCGDFHPGKKPIVDVHAFNSETGQMHIMDLKYSSHRDYNVEKNGQLKINAVAAYEELSPELRKKIKSVRLHILQPRKPYMEEWGFSIEELLDFRTYAREVYEEIHDPEKRKFKWSTKCVFCPVSVRCRHAKNEIVSIVFGSSELPGEDALEKFRHHDAMSNDELFELWPYFDLIASWANNGVKFMNQAALQGQQFGDTKLVEGKKSNKTWVDVEEAEVYLVGKLGEDAYEKKLKSPTQASHLLGKEISESDDFLELYTQNDGKPKLASGDDPRQPYFNVLLDELEDDD